MENAGKDGPAIRLLVKEAIAETRDFKTFVFEDGHGIDYESGQFLTLIHQGINGEVRRSYSIVSSPSLNERLAIGVKRVANGFFSRLLVDTVAAGSVLLTTGAGGFFRLPANTAAFEKVVFFAAGSGITPVLSLIKTILADHPHLSIVLVYSNSSPESAVYFEQLSRMENDSGGKLRIHFLFSDSIDLLRARLNRTSFFDLLYAANLDVDRTLFYTCGPNAYMRMVIFLLEEFGVALNKIRKEEFDPFINAPAKRVPPDTGLHFVSIRQKNGTIKFPVRYPDTILRAARAHGLVMPYSCENGRCGNCAARCLSGEVWLSNNEVLTDEDLRNGLTLTCVGHPVNGDVQLMIG